MEFLWIGMALPVVVGALVLLTAARRERRAGARAMPIAAALVVVLLVLFVRDLAVGLPVLPLVGLLALLLVPVIACAWRPWIVVLVLLSYATSAAGMLWARWDWRWDHQLEVTRAQGLEEGGWELFARAAGKRHHAALYPLLSRVDDEDAATFDLFLSMPGGGGPVAYDVSATVATEGRPARSLEPASSGPFRTGPVEVHLDAEGNRTEVPRLATTLRIPLREIGRRSVVVLDLEMAPEGRSGRRRITLTVEYVRRVGLHVQRARL